MTDTTKAIVVEFHVGEEVKTLRKEDQWTLEAATRFAREYLEEFLNMDLADDEEEDEFEVVVEDRQDGSRRVGFMKKNQEQVDTMYFLEVREVSVQ